MSDPTFIDEYTLLPLWPPQKLNNIMLGHIGIPGYGYDRGYPAWGGYKEWVFNDFTTKYYEIAATTISTYLPPGEQGAYLNDCKNVYTNPMLIPSTAVHWEPAQWPWQYKGVMADLSTWKDKWRECLDDLTPLYEGSYSCAFYARTQAFWACYTLQARGAWILDHCQYGLPPV